MGVRVMQKYVCIVLALIYVFGANVAEAKVYWLPDFLQENQDRVNKFDDDDRYDGQKCPVGWISASEATGLKCEGRANFPNAGVCYYGCVDPCAGLTDYSCEAYGCEEYYSECPSKCKKCYENNCHVREDNDIGYGCQEYWDDCSIKCEIPYEDNCRNREDNIINEEWGCKQNWADCPSKCEKPNEDNCLNREDNETDYGCQKYWNDCPEKCEIGTTCLPRDCAAEGYNLMAAPANASYEECSPGCGNNTKYYRFVSCNLGYYDKEKFICEGKQLCTWSIN